MARRKNILDQGELAILEKETKSYEEHIKEITFTLLMVTL